MQYNHSSFGVIGGRVQVTQWRGGGMPITTIAYHGGAGGSKSSWATDFKFENCWHTRIFIHLFTQAAAGKKIRCMRICEKRVASFNKTQ